MGIDRRATAAGFAAAFAVLAVLVAVVGVGDLASALRQAQLLVLPAVLVAAIIWVTSWGVALGVVCRALGVAVSIPQVVVVYVGALFANNVTPLGQAGGEPITAFLVSSVGDTEYETGLAAIASADTVNFVPSTVFAVVGFAYLSVAVTLGPRLRLAAGMIAAAAVVVPVVAAVLWWHRRRVEAAVARVTVPVARAVGANVPRVRVPTKAGIEARIGGFFQSLEVVARDRRTLAAAVGLSALGWFAQMLSLWLSLYALGVTAPLAAVFVAVPVGAFAGVTVLPGGLGGVEAVLVVLLVPTVGISAATALAAVLVHRTATYWLPMLLGGAVVTTLGVDAVAS